MVNVPLLISGTASRKRNEASVTKVASCFCNSVLIASDFNMEAEKLRLKKPFNDN